LKKGNKNDRIDARKLAELLRTNQLTAVYHEEHGIRALKELGRIYLTITKDVTRVMNRIKALYRSWGIPCSGTSVDALCHRAEWLARIWCRWRTRVGIGDGWGISRNKATLCCVSC
jgi:hypothetical protein